jgi:hypothetical protein
MNKKLSKKSQKALMQFFKKHAAEKLEFHVQKALNAYFGKTTDKGMKPETKKLVEGIRFLLNALTHIRQYGYKALDKESPDKLNETLMNCFDANEPKDMSFYLMELSTAFFEEVFNSHSPAEEEKEFLECFHDFFVVLYKIQNIETVMVNETAN